MANEIRTTSLEVALEIAEASLDQFLKEGFLRDVPVIGTVYKLACLGNSISDRIFLAKLLRFVKSLATISVEEKAAFIRKLDEDIETLQKVGETIVLIIDKLDDMEKPELLGKIFRAYVRGEITYDQFHRLFKAVEASIFSDLLQFAASDSHDDEAVLKRLMASGLTITSRTGFTGGGDYVFNQIEKTEIGVLLQKLLSDPT